MAPVLLKYLENMERCLDISYQKKKTHNIISRTHLPFKSTGFLNEDAV